MSDWPDIAGRFMPNGAHVLPARVYYEDTDFSGVVYHASYLRFCERGRTDFLRLLNIGHRELEAQGLAFAVKKLEADFHQPARIDDLLEVHTSLAQLGGASISLQQRVKRGANALFTLNVKVAVIRLEGGAARLPLSVKQALEPKLNPAK